jgi:predicted transglutaminase-like cysteine proteinase
MARYLHAILAVTLAGAVLPGDAEARSRSPQEANLPPALMEASPTLAPFQHVRFCLRYPSDCKTSLSESDRVEFSTETSELLKRVNSSINTSIIPASKTYGANLGDGWTIAPNMGDCNDYAVTKRHELLESGLPSRALRLSVVKTASGIGHLVLVVATTRGDLVMDNLTEAIRPWQSTGYQWLKIQSATDAKFWHEVKLPVRGPSISQADQKVRLADR